MNTFMPDRLQTFLDTPEDRPITMLNLLRFQPDGGREQYCRYLDAAEPILARHGATISYVGNTLPALIAAAGQEWDAVVLVRYPGTHAFEGLFSDADYAKVRHLREAALADALLQPMVEAAR